MHRTKIYLNRVDTNFAEGGDVEAVKRDYFDNYASIVKSLNVALMVERRPDLEKAEDQIAIAITEDRSSRGRNAEVRSGPIRVR